MGADTYDSPTTYRIFISFTGTDRALAEYLATGLRRNLDDFDSVYCFSRPGRYNSKAGSRLADDFMKVVDDSLKNLMCSCFYGLLMLEIQAGSGTNLIKPDISA
jgi:hypothetical protein